MTDMSFRPTFSSAEDDAERELFVQHDMSTRLTSCIRIAVPTDLSAENLSCSMAHLFTDMTVGEDAT